MIDRIIDRLNMATIVLPNSEKHFENPQDGKYVEEVVLKDDAIQIVKEEFENEEELKPCPFCGGKEIIVMADTGTSRVNIWCECNKCFAKSTKYGAETEYKFDAMYNIDRAKAKAILSWNGRKNEENATK